MPTSDAEGREWVAGILDRIGPDLLLIVDVGPGDGTYERVFRAQTPNARWIGLEIHEPYVEKYSLREKYDDVVVADVRKAIWSGPGIEDDTPDLVILGDVLEHMEAHEAITLVKNLREAGVGNIIVSLPIIESIQGEVDGNPHEAHLAQWNFEDMLTLMTPCSAWRGNVLGRFWWKKPAEK